MVKFLDEVDVNPSGSSSRQAGKWDVIEPVGKRVVIRKDENRRETKSGIVLPGNHEIPVLTLVEAGDCDFEVD